MTDTRGKIKKLWCTLQLRCYYVSFWFHLKTYTSTNTVLKCILKESGHESFDWINVVQDMVQRQPHMNTVLNFLVP